MLAPSDGLNELFYWDVTSGLLRQATDSPYGVERGVVDPGGRMIWWFAYEGAGQVGKWMCARIGGGPAREGWPGVGGLPEGFALAEDGSAAAAFSSPDGSTTLHRTDAPGAPGERQVLPYLAYLSGLSPDGRYLLVTHADRRDPRAPAVRLLTHDGTIRAELAESPASGLFAQRYGQPFLPDGRVLLTSTRDDRYRPLLWDPVTGRTDEVVTGLPGDVFAQPAAGDSDVLLHHRYQGRSELYRARPGRGAPVRIDVPPGTVHGFGQRPDGDAWFLHSSTASPPTLLSGRDGGPLLATFAPGTGANRPAAQHLRTPGPSGEVHSFLCRDQDLPLPAATVFLLHGGPAVDDGDEYQSTVNAWVDAGYAVVRINYRGSEGYGDRWRFAHEGQVGLAELADVLAVHAHLVGAGIADRRRCVLAGASWGGYLTLLGLGRHPELWSCGIAESPIGDYPRAFAEEPEQLRGLDRFLFGGGPEDVPERYRESSPVTYTSAVRAPVLVIAGDGDHRCPIGQVRGYVDALRTAGGHVRLVEHQSGHGSRSAAELDHYLTAQVKFASKHAKPG